MRSERREKILRFREIGTDPLLSGGGIGRRGNFIVLCPESVLEQRKGITKCATSENVLKQRRHVS